MGKCARNGAREVVKGKFDQLEVLELAQKSGYWAGDIGISDKERLEFGEFGDGGLDWAHEVGELVCVLCEFCIYLSLSINHFT